MAGRTGIHVFLVLVGLAHSVADENAGWGRWSEWSGCSQTCEEDGSEAVRIRVRNCTAHTPERCTAVCRGPTRKTFPCGLPKCAVDGGWGRWNQWAECSKTCVGGVRTRRRVCDNPAPKYGGRHCEGGREMMTVCNNNPCPVDGGWGSWNQWAECSKTCAGGVRTRRRVCDNPAPDYGGRHCEGGRQRITVCNNNPCPVDGQWSAWSAWGGCRVPYCSPRDGLQIRSRACTNPSPLVGGKDCPGERHSAQACNRRYPHCRIDGTWCSWGSWSVQMSKEVRVRTCGCPAPQRGGADCIGQEAKQQREVVSEPGSGSGSGSGSGCQSGDGSQPGCG